MATQFLKARAVGNEARVTLPDEGGPNDFEIHAVYAEVITHGPPAGQRQIRILIIDKEADVVGITGGDTQPNNSTRHYMAFPTAVLERVTSGDDIQWLPWPGTTVVPRGTSIVVRNVGATAPNDEIRLRVQFDSSLSARGG